MTEATATGRVFDGQIILEGPSDAAVRVVPPPGIRVLVDGKEQGGPWDWRAGDPLPSVEMRPPKELPPFSVTVDGGGRKAFVSIQPSVSYHLIDCPPQNPLYLQVAPESQVPDLSPEAIRSALTGLGIRAGIHDDILVELGSHPREGRIVIAEEIPSVPGENGRIEILFQGTSHPLMEERGDGSMKWRTTLDIPVIHAGEVLARRLPPTPGQPGINLFGQPIPPMAGREARLTAGKGVELIDDGNGARAVQEGLPRVMPLGPLHIRLEVDPAYVHQGNVNLASGNLHFEDDLVIRGSLEHGASVSSAGRIQIDGEAERAQISGERGIRVAGNVFSSTLTSGQHAAFYATLQPVLEDLFHQIENVSSHLISEPQQPLTADAFRSVIWEQSPTLPKLLIEAGQHIQEASFPLDPAILEQEVVLVHLTRIVTDALREPHTLVEWDKHLPAHLQLLMETVTSLAWTPSTIAAHAVQECTIVSGGNVQIEQAAFNSHITASGTVEIEGTARGSHIRGTQGISVREAGSPNGAGTVLETSSGGEIRMVECWPGVEIRLGPVHYQFQTHGSRIRARLVEGRLDLG